MLLAEKQIKTVIEDRDARVALAEKSLEFFTIFYLAHYIKSTTPTIHWDIYKDLQNVDEKLMLLIAFRGCAKSTLTSLALPLWSAIFGKKKFIVVCSDTGTQSGQLIQNIISELDGNERLLADFGSFATKDKAWTASKILLNNNTLIMSRSTGQQVRGLRHEEQRIDLFIADDIENVEHVKTKEQRDKTEEWFISDVMPAVDQEIGHIKVVGSLLHSDSLLARLKKTITENEMGKVREYPLLDKNGESVWKELYTEERINFLRSQNDRYFRREYLLEIVPDEGTVIEKIHYYEKAPTIKYLAVGTDVAISQKQTADYTAFNLAGQGTDGKIYNLHSFKKRLSFNDTLLELNKLYLKSKRDYPNVPIQVGWEDVGYQRAGGEEIIRRYNIPLKFVKRSVDKRSRLHTIEPHLTSGNILFREKEDNDLAIEILHFGTEAHDDLMDAAEMSYALLLERISPSIDWI